MQGAKMTNNSKDWNFASSCLSVANSGYDHSIAQDLEKPTGKEISQLLYEQENSKNTETNKE